MDKHKNFRDFEFLCDAKIRTEDGWEFPIHRVLLAMRSEYFRDMFENVPIEQTDFTIPKIHGSIMEIILEYIYTEKVIFTENNIADILAAARLLDIKKLFKDSRFLTVSYFTITNSVSLFNEVTKNKKLNIFKVSSRFIEANFAEIVRNENSRFEDLMPGSLERLLFFDSLYVSSEEKIWKAIQRWIGKCSKERKVFLKNLLPSIQFNRSCNDLTVDVLNHPLIKEDPSHITLIENISKQPVLLKHRFPKILHLFTKSRRNESNPMETSRMSSEYDNEIFISYDENIDLCKSVYTFTRKFYPKVVMHGCGSIFVMADTSKNIMYTFDILSKTLSILNPLNVSRESFNVVKLRNHIYVLGGFLFDNEAGVLSNQLERYDFNSERWEFAAPHDHLVFTEAVVFENKIYFVGYHRNNHTSHVGQVYDPDTDRWHSISSPKVSMNSIFSRFSLTVYKDRLFKINDKNCLPSVQVYDACSDTWRDFETLPFSYDAPKARAIKDILFVFDTDHRHPSVLWNESSHQWQVVEASSPLYDLQMYEFCYMDDSAVIKEIKKDNTDSHVRWVATPFFVLLNS